jgi:type 1 glutamine amidotransferase
MAVFRLLGISGLGLMLVFTTAQSKPIRVGAFEGVGTSGAGWHDMIHTASRVIGTILANPDAENIGPNLVVPPGGVQYTPFGRVTGAGTPGTEEKASFLAALDTLDVVVFISNTAFETIFPDSTERARLADFWRRKGVVSIHTTTDSRGQWPLWDSLHGTRFRNHPSTDRTGTLRLDTAARADASWRFLNRSLSDTAFQDEWMYFTATGESIRSTPGLKVTVNLDEATISGTNLPAPMGDHPMSWYRDFPEGGRFFYTAMGHRPNVWTSATNQPRFVRRQVYNAILWAAGVDSTGAVSVRNPQVTRAGRGFTDAARLSLSGGTLTVSLLRDGAHTVEILGLDGRRVASRRGAGRGGYAFENLRPGAVYAVTVTAGGQRFTRMAVIK